VTDTDVSSYNYTTELPDATATNYVNYIPKGDILKTEFMDRNLGATDAFPLAVDPLTPTAAELAKIRASTGLQYQWGRKILFHHFKTQITDQAIMSFLGSVSSNGTVAYTTYSGSI
jgi:hypothetical protein